MNDNEIKQRIFFNKIFRKSRADIKKEACIFCGEKVTSFCNSHSTPRVILNHIADKGKVLYWTSTSDIECLDTEAGINKAGVFYLLCNKCDSKIFLEYENEEHLTLNSLMDEKVLNKVIAQIALKNTLSQIYQKKLGAKILLNGIGAEPLYSKVDLDELYKDYEIIKRTIKRMNTDKVFNIVWKYELPYTVPIAFQNEIALKFDLEGCKINDTLYPDPNYKIRMMHICIFPMASKTLILCFYYSKYKIYRKFSKQFAKLDDLAKLKVLNVLIFLYSDSWFISPTLNDIIISSDKLKNMCRTVLDDEFINCNLNSIYGDASNKILSIIDDIPNLLLYDSKGVKHDLQEG